MSALDFQFCPKIAIFNQANTSVFLCKRKGELDYDGVFSLIGGKMEHKDEDIIGALRREKIEEVGKDFQINILPYYSVDVLYTKKDGNRMILPHYYAKFVAGDVHLSDEYSTCEWVPLAELASFEPMIANIRWIGPLLLRVATITQDTELVLI
jgi:ADP-ribose pyrophosphatase YjhB (NUDIX family)